jgi:hypothetical protein
MDFAHLTDCCFGLYSISRSAAQTNCLALARSLSISRRFRVALRSAAQNPNARRVIFGAYLDTLFRESTAMILELQGRLTHALIWAVLGKFPGGLFGLIAYILFLVLTLVKVLRLYIDAVPVGK